MDSKIFEAIARELVWEYYNNNEIATVNDEDIFVVWSCKTLQNNKALLSTSISDGRYFEITYNGDKEEVYFDSYKKEFNKCFKLEK